MSVAFRRESDDEHLEPKFELPPTADSLQLYLATCVLFFFLAWWFNQVVSCCGKMGRGRPVYFMCDPRYWVADVVVGNKPLLARCKTARDEHQLSKLDADRKGKLGPILGVSLVTLAYTSIGGLPVSLATDQIQGVGVAALAIIVSIGAFYYSPIDSDAERDAFEAITSYDEPYKVRGLAPTPCLPRALARPMRLA